MSQVCKMKSRNLDREDIPEAGSCKSCHKQHDTLSGFLRHVTQSKCCLDDYDPEYIEKLKRESRLRSKRRWHAKYWEPHLKHEQKNRRSSIENKHVPVLERRSDGGRAFRNLYNSVFEKSIEKATTRMEDLSKKHVIPSEISDDLTDDTLDIVFNQCDSVFTTIKKGASEFDTLQAAFRSIEAKFDDKFKATYMEMQESWAVYTINEITLDLFPNSLDRAYSTFYKSEKFKNCFLKSQDSVLDLIFLKLLVTDNYFQVDNMEHLEAALEKTFRRLFEEELEKNASECGLAQELETWIDALLEKRFLKCKLQFKE